MGRSHKHAAIIHAYADGAQVEYLGPNGVWRSTMYPDFDPLIEYRIKPEPPKYPRTRMTNADYAKVLNCGDKFNLLGCENVANAAIARAIEDGDVVPAAMLEKVAQEVEWAVRNSCNYIYCGQPTDISAIITKAREGK